MVLLNPMDINTGMVLLNLMDINRSFYLIIKHLLCFRDHSSVGIHVVICKDRILNRESPLTILKE